MKLTQVICHWPALQMYVEMTPRIEIKDQLLSKSPVNFPTNAIGLALESGTFPLRFPGAVVSFCPQLHV